MKFLLAAINAKYIHSNLGIYSLKKFADARLGQEGQGSAEEDLSFGTTVQTVANPTEATQTTASSAGAVQTVASSTSHPVNIELGEYTINNQMDLILEDIYRRKPDAIGFSCYIWNINYVRELLRDLHKVLPDTDIWLGGPEVSFDASKELEREPEVLGIMKGEGEETFAELMEYYRDDRKDYWNIGGVATRNSEGVIVEQPVRPILDMSSIPFSYGNLSGMEHRIIYYESSRGCPFSCSYCLSSIDKSVRFRDIELVKKELDFFLEHKVPQVKFVDRTFNCKKSHSMAIWKHILEHDNGVTNFHFEIAADLLDEEELELIRHMRPGLIQLEIGVQTTNPETIQEIHRKMNLDEVRQIVDQINSFRNIHQHLDLIAGLPHEGYESFGHSFDDVYAMKPEQLQLGFLKVLKGSYMADMTEEYGLLYKSLPPYEVLSTKWLTYGEVLKLKGVEDMTEVYYNSGQFRTTMARLVQEFERPFLLYESLAEYYEENHFFGISHNRLARYEILDQFIGEMFPEKQAYYRDYLMYDLYLRENIKSRPSFASDQMPYKERVREFFQGEKTQPVYLTGYENYDARQISKMAHAEVFSDGTMVVFDYQKRNPLTYNAKAQVVS